MDRILKAIPAHRDAVHSVAFTARRPVMLATGDVNGEVKLWDVTSGKQHPGLPSKTHRSMVNRLAFSPDGRRLASGSFDNTIKIWDMTERHGDPKVLFGHAGPVHHLVFSENGRTLISCGGDKKVRVWDVESLQTKAVLDCDGAVNRLAWSKDETVLTSAVAEGVIHLWYAPKTDTRR